VNQNGVWPWREQDRILIPLEQQSRSGRKAIPVELFYSSQIGSAGARALDLELLAAKFDLPLENITWRVYLNEKWPAQGLDRHVAVAGRPGRSARRRHGRGNLSAKMKRAPNARRRRKRSKCWRRATPRSNKAIRNRPGAPFKPLTV